MDNILTRSGSNIQNNEQISSAFRLNPAGGMPPPQPQQPPQPQPFQQFGGVQTAGGIKGFIMNRSVTTWALVATFIIETVLYYMYEKGEYKASLRVSIAGIILPTILFAFLYFLNDSAFGIVGFIPATILKPLLLTIVFALGWFHTLDLIAKRVM
jgi:hypothetical protein